MKRLLVALGIAIGVYAPLVLLVLWAAPEGSLVRWVVIGEGHAITPLFPAVLIFSAWLSDRLYRKPKP